MKIDADDFRVEPGKVLRLDDRPTSIKPCCKSKKQYRKTLASHVEELSSLQQLHYASHRYALLLIFQGIDAAGKDGAIRHVMSGVNPQGAVAKESLEYLLFLVCVGPLPFQTSLNLDRRDWANDSRTGDYSVTNPSCSFLIHTIPPFFEAA